MFQFRKDPVAPQFCLDQLPPHCCPPRRHEKLLSITKSSETYVYCIEKYPENLARSYFFSLYRIPPTAVCPCVLYVAENTAEKAGDGARSTALSTNPPVTFHSAFTSVPPLLTTSVVHIQDALVSPIFRTIPKIDIAADRSLSESSGSVGDEEDPAPHTWDVRESGSRLAGE